MTYRDWPNPGLLQDGISKVGLMKPAAYNYTHLLGTRNDRNFLIAIPGTEKRRWVTLIGQSHLSNP
jgi:hypothetical protein